MEAKNLSLLILLASVVVASGCIGGTENSVTISEPDGEGSVSPSPSQISVKEGSNLNLNASPSEGWEFKGWKQNGSIVSSKANYVVSPENDIELTPVFYQPAEFEVNEFKINQNLVKPGETVTATASVSNAGGSQGTYELVISSESGEEHSESIELEPNESKSLDIEFEKERESEYTFSLEDKQVSFTVDSATFISNAEEFNDIRRDLEREYKLENDIDLSNIDSGDFAAIGNDNNKFQGFLDGQGHTVFNYNIDSPGSNYVGLFGFIGEQGEIKNINVEGFDIEGDEYVGGLAAVNNGKVSDSSAEGQIEGVEHVGGLIGHTWDEGRVLGSSSNADVKGDRYIGGLVGDNDGSISDSSSTATVDGFGWVGGLVGRDLGKVVNSDSNAEVSGSTKVAYGEASMKEIEENNEDLEDISYEGLMRNPSDHKNKLISYEGLITQIVDSDNIRNYHIYTDYYTGYRGTRYWSSGRIKSYWKSEHVEEDYTTFDIEGERLLEEDLVRVYGIFRGLHTYETTQGDTNTVPNVEIRHIEQIEEIE